MGRRTDRKQRLVRDTFPPILRLNVFELRPLFPGEVIRYLADESDAGGERRYRVLTVVGALVVREAPAGNGDEPRVLNRLFVQATTSFVAM
ncbi:hypothetical protein [Brevibacillus borstelensis]|uniref:hypothetical protein n=1 Tax=Brevibacillus borstelensis TaxID=45462 RepID=UPI002E1F038B|nr:hypothetical protein [Brevibacillus borstelensis]